MYLHRNLKYIHFIANFFGALWIRFDSKNNIPKFTVSGLGVFWCALLWVTYGVYRISTFIMHIDVGLKLENYTELFELSLDLLCTIITFSRQNLLIQALNELAEVDKSQKNMRNLIGNKLTFYVSGIGMISIIIGVIPTIVLYADNLISFVGSISSNIKLLEVTLFETYLLLLRSRLRIVNRQLSNLSKSTQELVLRQPRFFQVLQSNSNLKKLKKLRKLHSKLCSICEKINKVFALQLLVIIGTLFAMFTGTAYGFIENLLSILAGADEWHIVLTLFLVSLANLSNLTILCLVCTKTKNEVFRTADILFQFKSKYDSGISKEIQRFSRQILHWNLKFTAFDFFDIDMTLIYDIITSATTYVTILMQLRKKL